jgi:DNA-binding FadR family transcriptional regulator
LAIDVLPELTAAQQESRRRLNAWLDALKSPDPERIRSAMQEFVAASQQKWAVWRAMATPRPTE